MAAPTSRSGLPECPARSAASTHRRAWRGSAPGSVFRSGAGGTGRLHCTFGWQSQAAEPLPTTGIDVTGESFHGWPSFSNFQWSGDDSGFVAMMAEPYAVCSIGLESAAIDSARLSSSWVTPSNAMSWHVVLLCGSYDLLQNSAIAMAIIGRPCSTSRCIGSSLFEVNVLTANQE